MAGALPTKWTGPDTCEVSVPVSGGQLVVPDGTTGKVKPSAGGETTVLGVALTDAQPRGSAPTNPIHTNWPSPYTSVAHSGVDIIVTYAAAAPYGARLKAAANGQVTPYVSGTDTADMIVGICTEPRGVAEGAKGRARIL